MHSPSSSLFHCQSNAMLCIALPGPQGFGWSSGFEAEDLVCPCLWLDLGGTCAWLIACMKIETKHNTNGRGSKSRTLVNILNINQITQQNEIEEC